MDRMLFQETFSQLHASDGAKQEVLQMTGNTADGAWRVRPG